MKETSDATFTEDIKQDKPVLVDFWAEWCGPCRIVHPILAEIAEEDDRFSILSLNVDHNPETARAFGVQSIPTMILFRDGEEVKRLIGALPKKAILAEVTPFL